MSWVLTTQFTPVSSQLSVHLVSLASPPDCEQHFRGKDHILYMFDSPENRALDALPNHVLVLLPTLCLAVTPPLSPSHRKAHHRERNNGDNKAGIILNLFTCVCTHIEIIYKICYCYGLRVYPPT